MDTQNLARWIDELQGQISDLRIKVDTPAPEPVDNDVTPFVNPDVTETATITEDTAITATYDCFICASGATLYIKTSDNTWAGLFSNSAYIKKGQIVQISPDSTSADYTVFALYGGEQPPAPDPTPDVAPAADTRSTKKKK